MFEALLVFALAIGLGWPLGRHLAAVMRGTPSRSDRVFLPIEQPLYRLLGIDPARGMTWRGYARAFALSNLALGAATWSLFMTQAWLPFNPDAVPNLRWDTALHTMVSFLTNTNQQHYSGQAQLSYLSQTVGIVGLQVITPMMGLALVAATLRALMGGRRAMRADTEPATASGGDIDVGNYWADTLRATVRVMLPLCLLWSVLLTAQDVPSTLQAGPVATPVDAGRRQRRHARAEDPATSAHARASPPCCCSSSRRWSPGGSHRACARRCSPCAPPTRTRPRCRRWAGNSPSRRIWHR
jgi:K+-transporting ATPase ATPase A chain